MWKGNVCILIGKYKYQSHIGIQVVVVEENYRAVAVASAKMPSKRCLHLVMYEIVYGLVQRIDISINLDLVKQWLGGEIGILSLSTTRK